MHWSRARADRDDRRGASAITPRRPLVPAGERHAVARLLGDVPGLGAGRFRLHHSYLHSDRHPEQLHYRSGAGRGAWNCHALHEVRRRSPGGYRGRSVGASAAPHDFDPVVLALRRFERFSTSYAMLFGFRALFGIGMGGEWAAGMPLVLEHWPARLRGIASGLLQGGWEW